MSSQFYLDKLYPLQDQVLAVIAKLDTKFYLTGGTAVSRYYFHHRFSDDLDFFLNHDNDFISEAEKILEGLKSVYGESTRLSLKQERFVRLFVSYDDTVLKIEMINDVGYRYGDSNVVNGIKIDNIQNVLSNKLSALQRNAPKDVSDILLIVFNLRFSWIDVFEQAKNKDTWVNEIDVATQLDDYEIENLQAVKWTKEPDYLFLKKCLHVIAKDILLGADNSLCGLGNEQLAFHNGANY